MISAEKETKFFDFSSTVRVDSADRELAAALNKLANTLLQRTKKPIVLPKELIAKHSRQEPRMITVRLPADLHQGLIEEAEARKTSLNKLCLVKLSQALED